MIENTIFVLDGTYQGFEILFLHINFLRRSRIKETNYTLQIRHVLQACQDCSSTEKISFGILEFKSF